MDEVPIPKRILLLTHARTASHVLQRMLSQQPTCLYGSHFFAPARQLRRDLLFQGPTSRTNPELRNELKSKLANCYRELENFFAEAELQNKIAFIHNQPHAMLSPALAAERVYGERPDETELNFWKIANPSAPTPCHSNITVLPDEAFLHPGTRPIINFRHPILVVEGAYRASTTLSALKLDSEELHRLMAIAGTLSWIRMMYDWYLEYGVPLGIKPVLVEADDYMGSGKEAVMKALCREVGLDASHVIYSWPKATSDEISAMPLGLAQSLKTLSESEGILPGYDSQGRDLDTEMLTWISKYGEEGANLMRDLVERAMPDYEYLRRQRLKVQT